MGSDLSDNGAEDAVGQFPDLGLPVSDHWSDPGHQEAEVIFKDGVRLLTLDQLHETLQAVNPDGAA